MTDEDKADYRQSARKVFELCDKLNIVAVHEARRIEDVEKAIRRALQMAENETF